MRDIRKKGSVVGNDRIAIMAAINITYEFLNTAKRQQQADTQVESIEEKLAATLEKMSQVSL